MDPASTTPTPTPNSVDSDGMPIAPAEVLTSRQGAYCVMGNAMGQATSFHVPTAQETTLMINILEAFYTSKLNGSTIATTQQIMTNASALNLIVCRVKGTKTVTGPNGSTSTEPDNVLLFYTRPGITNYSGPFMMLRETKSSKFVIYGPHDDSDGTYAVTKVAMINSYALACFSNGHKRGSVSGGNITLYRESDWVHAANVSLNLGSIAIAHFATLFPGQVSILFNGIADPTKCMLRSRSDKMAQVFKTAVMDNSRITATDFTGYTPWFTIDSIVNTTNYIACEIPSVIYENNYNIITAIVKAMEQQTWCWSS